MDKDKKASLKDLKKKLQIKKREVKKEVEEKKEKAEEKKVEKPEDQFNLPFGGGTSEPAQDFYVPDELMSDEEIEKAEKKKLSTKALIVIGVFVVLLFIIFFFGYFLGQSFKAREIENIKIDEAKFLLNKITNKYTKDGKYKVLEAIEVFRGELQSFLKKLDTAKKKGKGLIEIKPMLLKFLTVCENYYDNQTTIFPNEFFTGMVYNFEVVKQGIPFLIVVNELWNLTGKAKQLKAKLKAIDKPKTEFKLTYFLKKVEDKEKGIETYVPIRIQAGEIQENPLWKKAKNKRKIHRWLIPYKELKKGAQTKAALPDEIITIDLGDIMYKVNVKYLNLLLEDIVKNIYVMNDILSNLNFKKLESVLKKYANKEKYFTF